MTTRSTLLLACAAFIPLATGCAIMKPIQEMSTTTWQMLRPNGSDYKDFSDADADEWSIVGREGRGERPMEKGGEWLYSPQARSIERNLGVGL